METTALLIRYPEMGWVADQKESLMKAFRTFGERKQILQVQGRSYWRVNTSKFQISGNFR
jgi:hypothetical protein